MLRGPILGLAMARKVAKARPAPKPKISNHVVEKKALEPPRPSSAIVEVGVDPQQSPVSAKRSQQGRRDLDGQVRRIIEDKLKHIDKVLLSTKTNKSGVKVFDYIRDHVAKAKQGNGWMSCFFWTQCWSEFDLAWDVGTELPEPEEGDCSDFDEELLEGIEKARSKNPAERHPGPIVALPGTLW